MTTEEPAGAGPVPPAPGTPPGDRVTPGGPVATDDLGPAAAEDGAVPGRGPEPPLRNDPDFRLLWTGDVGSRLGSEVTAVALPLLAVTTLDASGLEIGLLSVAFSAPFFAFPLVAGIWLDRRTRRPAMLGADLLRAALVISIPVAAWLDLLTLWQLYLVALVGGGLGVVYDVAAQSYLPGLVGGRRLVGANSALNANMAVGATAGPGLAGWLTSLIGAASTLVLDAVSYLVSAFTLARIRHREPEPPPQPDRDVRRELGEGLRSVLGNPPVRAIGLHAAIYNAGVELVSVAFIVYFVRDLGLPSWAYGVVLVIGGLGSIVGTLAAPAVVSRLGYGPALLVSLLASTFPFALLPLATSDVQVAVLSSVGFFLGWAGTGVGGTVAVTVRQLLTPPRLLARMTASYRMLSFGTIPVGALAGGLLVDTAGARATLWTAPVVLVLSGLPVLLSRSVRGLGQLEDAPGQAD